MARILAISSQVVSGHVGLSAIVPSLQRLGHEVLALPTIILSNHPGNQPATGTRVAADVLSKMVETLEANGRLSGIGAVLTGYMPSPAHVAFAADVIAHCRAINPGMVVLCDPVIGDDPKGVYIEQEAAAAIRSELLPLASIATPNRFELAWLASEAVVDAASAIAAARTLAVDVLVATSIPSGGDQLATLAITPGLVAEARVPRRDRVPNGTGDLLAALFVSEYLATKHDAAAALRVAVDAVDRALDASWGRTELNLTRDWRITASGD